MSIQVLASEELGPSTLAWAKSYRFRSSAIPQDFLIEVALPPAPLQADQRFAVVYVLDGNSAFPMASAAARGIQSGPFPMPPTLVVGVGYYFDRPEDRAQAWTLRVRDLTPCSDALWEAQYPGRGAVTGGADAFLNFIQNELKPFIAAHYPVADDDNTLVGSSMAGLFALNVLLTAPGSFQRYVAISPAIYWGGGKLFELEDALAASAADLPASVYLAAGALEEAHDVKQAFVSNVYRLEAALRSRNYPGLKLERQIFEGETHMSVYPGAVTRGLGSVFGGYRDMHDWARWLQQR
jgi:uncharacterized protein